MAHIKAYFYLIMLLPAFSHAAQTASATMQLEMPSLDKLADTVKKAASDITTSADKLVGSFDRLTASLPGIGSVVKELQPTAPTILALIAGFYSARQLFSEYPKKPINERTQSDWMIPTAGFTLSAGTLWYLWSLQQK